MFYQLLPYRSSTIHYLRMGAGKRVVICLHGYGETAGAFTCFQQFGADYTFVAIDLPFHGRTTWQEAGDFSGTHLQQILQLLFAREQLPDTGFVLMGYSMGGRIALGLYESIPASVHKLLLLAPDGLIVNPWYWLATQTHMGNRLFKYTMRHPQWLLGILKAGRRAKLVNASMYTFALQYINDPFVRDALYQRWTGMRKFRPHIGRIQQKIVQHQTPVRLVFGAYDRIISATTATALQRRLGALCQVSMLSAGHQLLRQKHVADIMEQLHR